MTDFTSHSPTDNLAALRYFRFIPVDYLTSIPTAAGGKITGPLSYVTGRGWFSGYSTFEMVDYKEEGSETANGPLYKFSLTGFLPKISLAQSQNLDEMAEHRFLLDTIDNNGNRKLVGSMDNPLGFRSTEGSEKKVAGKNGYDFVFYGEYYPKAYNYEDNTGYSQPIDDPPPA